MRWHARPTTPADAICREAVADVERARASVALAASSPLATSTRCAIAAGHAALERCPALGGEWAGTIDAWERARRERHGDLWADGDWVAETHWVRLDCASGYNLEHIAGNMSGTEARTVESDVIDINKSSTLIFHLQKGDRHVIQLTREDVAGRWGTLTVPSGVLSAHWFESDSEPTIILQ